MDADRRAHLERSLDGYFDVRSQVLIGRVVNAATIEQLRDEDALDELFDAFIEVLDERYGRADPGWRPAAEQVLRVEFDRQVEQQRRLLDDLEAG